MTLDHNRIVIVDPICIGKSGIEEYTEGLFKGLIENGLDVYLFSHYSCSIKHKNVFKIFLIISERLSDGIFRKSIRAIEYFLQMLCSVILLIKYRPKIIHFNWLIFNPIDLIILKIIKKIFPNSKLIYTAHNVVPHNSKYNKKNLQNIYLICDKIIVHGQKLKLELQNNFPLINSKKIFSSFHGNKKKIKLEKPSCLISSNYNLESNNYILFTGLVNENKGVDYLLKTWKKIKKKNGFKLIVAGKVNKNFDAFFKELNKMSDDSFLLINEFLDVNKFNQLVYYSKLIVLPYVNGSVSGVLFTAAQYKKPVLSTNFGAIEEYIINHKTGYIVNSREEFKNKLEELLLIGDSSLKKIGVNNYKHLQKNFNWNIISKKIKNNCYEVL